MTKHATPPRQKNPFKFVVLGLVGLSIVLALLLWNSDIILMNPQGFVAAEQFELFLISSAMLLLIAVPTVFLFYYFAWKYRETNENAAYDPTGQHGTGFVFAIWAIPIVFMVVLGGLMWTATHRLEPQKAMASDVKPITIQVIAMRWKWLFVYPEHNIATVNFVQIPTGTPVRFELTADEVSMSSFWVPHLGGQLYAMTGHVNPLYLMAEKPGDYPGSSAELNGHGFAGMKFITRASSPEVYESWVRDVQANSTALTDDGYKELLKPSENNLVTFYNQADAGLHEKVVMKYAGAHEVHAGGKKAH